ncbi:MAG: hypothetical protein QXR81_01990 [Candidatus Nezhaarchaeales archaeon]
MGFGVAITALGALGMFSALVLVIVICEILKRSFKRGVLVGEAPSKEEVGEGISEEEKAAAIAAVTSYMGMKSALQASITASRGNVQPKVWSIAGRMGLMEKPIRRR